MPASTLGVLLNLSGVKYHFAFGAFKFPDDLWLDETCDVADCGEGAGDGGSNCGDVRCTPLEVLVLEDIGGYGGFG